MSLRHAMTPWRILRFQSLNSFHLQNIRRVNSKSIFLNSNTNIKTTSNNTKRYPKSIKVNPSKHLRRNVGKKSGSHDDQETANVLSTYKVKTCSVITTAEKYNLEKGIALLRDRGIIPVTLIPDEIITFKYIHEGEKTDIMVLADNGSVISWGLNEKELLDNFIPILSEARINPLDESKYETEDIDFIEIENSKALSKNMESHLHNGSYIMDDLLIVNSIDPELGLLDKAAFSSGIARSTSLAVLEAALEEHTQKSRIITEKFSRGIQINLKEKHFLTSIGKLFLIRGRLNLYSNIIETPDLYWSEPRLEKIYKNVSHFLDIAPRINILNSKLDYCTDHSRMLLSVLNEKKGTFLEWIIIYLITVEVCFELHHYWVSFQNSKEEKTI
ncbi:hypothetical protein TPHA_0D01710 [Tetrapisispora phaffii CBS 4417]|uniref:DUF155 domain-containing protein n=1 Tax=Tetrapisispora phaffii (strain ATCC 24235 / CBS 4417 / NBRC 1672 / NRRL Y-8282 / UCD 70-5) TaxID=1071381 RepID=G8BSJ0_TETPH|nr:hypothetical protein TPHA_0D01710 [Tetrapisispora phaffii CBS 4417]CCE62811.1 hypothetical protein TPHA_0D01710 [Tetrapisispora phaffii CBS 4417]